jgi:23S rRNA pseudouridine1911/1915/1917 synthase
MNEKEKFELFTIIADKGQTPLRVDKFLMNKIDNVSRTKIQKAAENGYLFVNDKIVKTNYKVKPGDIVKLTTYYKAEKIDVIPENIPIDIVFEDETILIINKKPGMVVHPAYGNETGTLVNALTYYLKDLPIFNSDSPRPGLVHRLDKNTSGLMVIAKTEEALSDIAKQFYNKQPEKIYNALVWGVPKTEQGSIKGHIGRSLQNRKIMTVFPEGEYGKEAITHYKLIKDLSYVSLLECQLETGRTHQIRVHLKYLGHPVFGDSEYGGNEILRGTRYTKYKQFINNCFQLMPHQALHAKSLSFIHPVLKKKVRFESELPENFKLLIQKWESYLQNR